MSLHDLINITSLIILPSLSSYNPLSALIPDPMGNFVASIMHVCLAKVQ
jgi:hypothetical protein